MIKPIHSIEESREIHSSLINELYVPEAAGLKKFTWNEHYLFSIAEYKDGELAGFVSLYQNKHLPEIVGLGNWEFSDKLLHDHTLLSYIKSLSFQWPIKKIIAPFHGNTWDSYRWPLDDEHPLFLTEIPYRAYYPQRLAHWEAKPIASYFSALDQSTELQEAKANRIEEQFSTQGIKLRSISLSDFETELKLLYPICIKAFQQNFLFSPISEEQFIHHYLPAKKFINENMVYLAMKEGICVGFIFCLPNLADRAQKGIIVKTVARLPEKNFAGLSTLLMNKVKKWALQDHYTYFIHAFMKNDNSSGIVSHRFSGTNIKNYALWELKIH